MNMKRNLLLSAAFVLTAQMAVALTADELVAQYQAEGYGYIEIKSGVSQIKIEAIKDGRKVEVIYDVATGAILKQEFYEVGTIGSVDNGPEIRVVDRDFVRGDDDNDDDGEDDDSVDDDEDEDDDDDGRGRGRGGDDDEDDDEDEDNYDEDDSPDDPDDNDSDDGDDD